MFYPVRIFYCIIQFLDKIHGSEIIRAFLVKSGQNLAAISNAKDGCAQTISRSIATVERFNQGLYLYFSALKSHDSNKYYINGNWVVDPPRRYNVAGTTCYYSRPRRNTGNEVEAFIAAGPTTEDLDVMVRVKF